MFTRALDHVTPSIILLSRVHALTHASRTVYQARDFQLGLSTRTLGRGNNKHTCRRYVSGVDGREPDRRLGLSQPFTRSPMEVFVLRSSTVIVVTVRTVVSLALSARGWYR